MVDLDRKTVFSSHQNTIGNAPKQWSAAEVRVTDGTGGRVSDPLSLWVGVAPQNRRVGHHTHGREPCFLDELQSPSAPGAAERLGHVERRALRAGANDLGGTLMSESISRAAGAAHGQEMTPASMRCIIDTLPADGRAQVRRRAWQRTTLYERAGEERVHAADAAGPLQTVDVG